MTLADDTVGTGPRLQLRGDITRKQASRVEALWNDWSEEVGLPEIIRRLVIAGYESGEAFIVFATNDKLRSPIKLFPKLIETDQVSSPNEGFDIGYGADRNDLVDGVLLDPVLSTPVAYFIEKRHPGAAYGSERVWDRYDADKVIHYFRPTRPGQHRGVPDITPAIPLFAQLRRYTLATVTAAEALANLALVIQATGSALPADVAEVEALDVFELERGMVTALPAGYQIGQPNPAQPTSTYREFKREILSEAARCVCQPYNVAAADSSDHNFASGRLDRQSYLKSIAGRRRHLERVAMSPIFRLFLRWATTIEPGDDRTALLPAKVRNAASQDDAPTHRWFWDGHDFIDPLKEANAQAVRLEAKTASLSQIMAESGQDWEEHLEQLFIEEKRRQELAEEYGVDLNDSDPEQDDEPDDEDEDEGDED